MKINIKNTIEFRISQEEENSVQIYDANKYLGHSSKGLCNILNLINGKERKEGIETLIEILSLDERTARFFYEQLYKAYEDIFGGSLRNENIRFFDNVSEKVNIKRIRSLQPKFLVISLTRNCFMRCKYCYAGAKYVVYDNKEANLPVSVIEKICMEAKELGIDKIDLTGGDPYIREDIGEIYTLFDHFGISTNLSTKKYLQEREIQVIQSHKCIKSIQISLDSLDDEIELFLLGEKEYATRRLKLIKKLLEKGIKVKVNSVLTKYNIDTVFELIDELDRIGIKEMALSPYTNNLYRHDETLFPHYSQYSVLSKKIENHKNNIRLSYPIFLREFSEDKIYGSMLRTTCGAGLNGLVVGPTGDVFICERLCYDTKYSLGNCKEKTLKEIWNSEAIEKYTAPDKENFINTKCFKCEDYDFCINERGVCYVHSLILNGNIFSLDSICKFNKGERRLF